MSGGGRMLRQVCAPPARLAAGADPVLAPAAAALLLGLLAQRRSVAAPEPELYSDVAAWALLPLLVARFAPGGEGPRSDGLPSAATGPSTARRSSLWVAAVGIAVAQLYRAENAEVVELFPLLTPLLLLLLVLSGRHSKSRLPGAPGYEVPRHAVGAAALAAAVFVTLALEPWDPLRYALSLGPVAGLAATYVAFSGSGILPSVDVQGVIRPLALRVVALLLVAAGLDRAVYGPPGFQVIGVLVLAAVKALAWYFTIRTARQSSWCVAPAIGTFALAATCDPFTQPSGTRALAQLVAALVALGQVIFVLPPHSKAKSALWIFALVPLVPYLANLLAIHRDQASIIQTHDHPVEALIQQARADFDDLVRRQSDSYPAARAEYQRRYRAPPPPGFEAWYDFAKQHRSPIIDDFDTLYEGISPLWSLSGQEIRDAMTWAYNDPSSDLWDCSFAAHSAETRCSHKVRTNDRHIQEFLGTLLQGLPEGVLPDIRFLVNHLDEPTVVFPSSADSTPRVSYYSGPQSPYAALTEPCFSSPRQEAAEPNRDDLLLPLPFVTNRTATLDLCRHPEYAAQHGLLSRPATLRLTRARVPVLSTGALATNADLLYPSAAYNESEFAYDPAADLPWARKAQALYWAGSTTGGRAERPADWATLQRQRFVALARGLDRAGGPHTYLAPDPSSTAGAGAAVRPYASRFLAARRFRASLTRIAGCAPAACRAQRRAFRRATAPWQDRHAALGSALAFDVDGNGVSGRFYRLLGSASAPLKATLLREWHDDRLVPWRHYVPVSLGMRELPELVRWLTGCELGRRRAREVGEAGREWFARAFREEDFRVYVFRLMLELARLQDRERAAGRMGADGLVGFE
ncbi:hypothetical protein F4780DRAFT_791957 [Xylariomycetidae sp. FL0641]|nr:hypothetical protein F4780DRAFT_791957 [Xylariomycetidae sp. FL0641]